MATNLWRANQTKKLRKQHCLCKRIVKSNYLSVLVPAPWRAVANIKDQVMRIRLDPLRLLPRRLLLADNSRQRACRLATLPNCNHQLIWTTNKLTSPLWLFSGQCRFALSELHYCPWLVAVFCRARAHLRLELASSPRASFPLSLSPSVFLV